MEPTFPREMHVQSLNGQVKEIYGRASYTQKAHEKMADMLTHRYHLIKLVEVVLSALASGSFLVSVFGSSEAGAIIGSILSTVLLGLVLYFKEATLGERAQRHADTATKLWGVREKLLSLLIDMRDGLRDVDARRIRDDLNGELEQIYKAAPRTSTAAYQAAQTALKQAEELFFTDEELNKMLPAVLRTTSS